MIPRMTLDIGWSDLGYGLVSTLGSSKPNYEDVESLWLKDQCFAHLSVRSAWDTFLATRDWPKGSEVFMSAVTIPHMADIVREWGYIPVPIDLELAGMSPRLEQMKEQASERTKAVLIAHLFGGFIDLNPIADLCEERGWALIEDCAQAYDGTPYRGHERSTMTMFSFGTIKSATALGGALVTVRDKGLLQVLVSHRDQQALHSQGKFAFKILKCSTLKGIGSPFLFGRLWKLASFLGIDFDQLLNSSVRGFSGDGFFERIRTQPPRALLKLLERRVSQELETFYAQRGEMVKALYEELPENVRAIGKEAQRHSSWVIPVLVPNPDKLTAMLRENGFDATCKSSSMKALKPENGYQEVPQAEEALNEVLYLPIYHPLGVEGYRRLGKLIYEYYKLEQEDK